MFVFIRYIESVSCIFLIIMFKKQTKKEKKAALHDCLLEGGDEQKITAINES